MTTLTTAVAMLTAGVSYAIIEGTMNAMATLSRRGAYLELRRTVVETGLEVPLITGDEMKTTKLTIRAAPVAMLCAAAVVEQLADSTTIGMMRMSAGSTRHRSSHTMTPAEVPETVGT